MVSRHDLVGMSVGGLADLMQGGYAVDRDAIADTRYHGTSLGLPRWVEALAWKKFIKVFHADPERGLRGWNLPAEQNPLEEPWIEKRPAAPYGYYLVESVAKAGPTAASTQLNYGLGGNRFRDGVGAIRDPLISLDPDGSSRLLGSSYVQLGSFAVATPSYFLLERGDPLTEFFDPPRG